MSVKRTLCGRSAMSAFDPKRTSSIPNLPCCTMQPSAWYGKNAKFEGQPVKRRDFITLVGGSAAAWPLTARAQQSSSRIPVVGVLWHAGSAEEERIPLGALVQGFSNLGYVEGRNIIFEHRFPNEQPERFDAFAAELVQIKVDVFIAVTRQAALAAQRATKTIPIVFMVVPDPVGSKLVDSLNQPGRNITGMTNMD